MIINKFLIKFDKHHELQNLKHESLDKPAAKNPAKCVCKRRKAL